MSFGKQSAPAPPDYSQIASASLDSAKLYNQLGQDQLQFYKDQYASAWPHVQDYLNSQTQAADENRTRANDYNTFYQDTYKPIESSFADTATNYATPERAEQRSGMAMADVANKFEASRKAALANLESYGIDPSQTRYGALDLSSRISQAAATAAAGTQSRLNTEAVGLGLQGEAIKTGRGYAPDISTAYNTATNAGSAGINAVNNTNAISAGSMGTPSSYFGASTGALNASSSAQNYGYNNAADAVRLNNQNTANTFGEIGQLAGGALGFGMYKGYI